jgi:hypothetical protein
LEFALASRFLSGKHAIAPCFLILSTVRRNFLNHHTLTILQEIVKYRRIDVERAKKQVSEESLRLMISSFSAPISLFERIKEQCPDVAIIAEIKRASPSKGLIAKDANASRIAQSYAACNVAGISVLTEPTYFKGSLEDLSISRRVLSSNIDNNVSNFKGQLQNSDGGYLVHIPIHDIILVFYY